MKKILYIFLIFASTAPIACSDLTEATETEQATEAENKLMNAIDHDDIDEVDKALKALAGASISFIMNDDEETPLLVAVQKGNAEMVDLVLQYFKRYHADELPEEANYKNKYGKTPLKIVTEKLKNVPITSKQKKEYEKIRSSLIENGATERKWDEVLLHAIEKNNPHWTAIGLSKLNKSGISLRGVKNRDGKTILRLAVDTGNPLIVNLVAAHLKKNYGITLMNVQSDDGITALEAAGQRLLTTSLDRLEDNKEIAKILLKYGATMKPENLKKYRSLQEVMKELETEKDAEKKEDDQKSLAAGKKEKKQVGFAQNLVKIQEYDKDAEPSAIKNVPTKKRKRDPILKVKK